VNVSKSGINETEASTIDVPKVVNVRNTSPEKNIIRANGL
jgi:hypothetical protein